MVNAGTNSTWLRREAIRSRNLVTHKPHFFELELRVRNNLTSIDYLIVAWVREIIDFEISDSIRN